MAIKNLCDLYKQKSADFIEKLLRSNVVIDDNVDGSFFSVKKSFDGWTYYRKGTQITLIERTISKFYEDAIAVFESMPEEKRASIPDNLIFVFKYITRNNGEDAIFPKDILKLTHIYDITRNQNMNDVETLNSWADKLGVGRPPIIFNGVLNDEQKDGIMSFVYTNQEELAKRFRSESFTKYIISLLNPDYETQGPFTFLILNPCSAYTTYRTITYLKHCNKKKRLPQRKPPFSTLSCFFLQIPFGHQGLQLPCHFTLTEQPSLATFSSGPGLLRK